MRPETSTTFLSSALWYAERGWPVLPLWPNAKTPRTRHGLHDASTDAEQIMRWWGQWPDANIGLRTGVAFDVLDLDSKEALASIIHLAQGTKHPGPVASTGKGFHLLYRPTGYRNGAGLLAGVDFRGDGGYIVAAPSRHPSGHRYKWVREPELPMPEPPRWLLDLVTPDVRERREGIRQGAIEELKDRMDIVGEFTKAGTRLTRRGSIFKGKCLFHQDDTPSMAVYPDTQSFYCFGCGAWGDVLNLHHFLSTGRLR